MATVITIDGSTVACAAAVPRRLSVPVGGVPTFVFDVPGGPLPTGAYPYLAKSIEVEIDGTTYFVGEVQDCEPRFTRAGWVRVYNCISLRGLGDRVAHRDGNSGGETSTFNASIDTDPYDYLPSRAGKTVGEIITAVLTMVGNATALDALGIGGYTTLSPPTLPTATVNDLALLTRVLPGPIRFTGERFLTALEGLLAAVAVNWRLVVRPDGVLRFLDTTNFPTAATLTLGTDPVDPPDLSRQLSECYSAILLTGQPVAQAFPFAVSLGTLTEAAFAYGGGTIADAKAAFVPNDYYRPACADQGTCVCTSTTSVTLTSDDATVTWPANFWNQTSGNRYGSLHLIHSAGTSIVMMAQRLVTSSASMSAGGTSVTGVDRALPHTDYNKYFIRGRRGGRQNVWTVYTLPTWAGAKVAPQTSYPYPFRNAAGNGLIQVSTAMGQVLWSANNSAPFAEVSIPIEVDPDSGTVIFPKPTFMMAGDRVPSDVRAYVPIWTDVNSVRVPSSGFEGAAYTVDGVERVLQVFVPTWRDPANLSAITSYAQDYLDSVKTPIVEGTVVYHGAYLGALTPGLKLSLASTDYTTGHESGAYPVMDATLEWVSGPGDPDLFRTSMRVSTKRGHYAVDAYLHPDRTGVTLDLGGSLDLSGIGSGAGAMSDALMGRLAGNELGRAGA
jgi:hypothetical protein